MAPQSNSEKQKRYRERLREQGRDKEMKERDKLRKRQKREQMTAKGRRILKTKNQEYKRRERERKKLLAQQVLQQDIETPSCSNYLDNPYSTPQAFGKAKKKVQDVLPKDCLKRIFVLKELLKLEGIDVKFSDNTNHQKPKVLTEQDKGIQDFFCRDDISWQSPGMKDFVIVRIDGEKCKIQKRYLLVSLKEAYELYLTDLGHKVSFSKFASLRPPNVLLMGNIPHNVCLCKIHENVNLLLKTINKHFPDFPLSFRQFIGKITCDQESEVCMTNICPSCPHFEHIQKDTEDKLCNWQQWISTHGNVTKQDFEGTYEDCFKLLKEKVPEFLQHTFIKRKQQVAFTCTKEGISQGEAVIQLGFAENYSCFEQNEIQAAHWTNKQITIFTSVCWLKDKYGKNVIESYSLVSDNLNHDKVAVHVFNNIVVNDIRSKYNIHTVHFFSDGAPSQFKQKYTICNLTYMEGLSKISWNFFATSHGKGAVDGIGGEVKRCARLAVHSGKSIRNAEDFVSVVAEKLKKVNVIVVQTEKFTQTEEVLSKRWRNIKGIPGLQQIHFIEVKSKDSVLYGKYTGTKDVYCHNFRA